MTKKRFFGDCVSDYVWRVQAIAQRWKAKVSKRLIKQMVYHSISMESPKEKLYLLLSEDLKPPLSTQECQVRKGFKEDLKEALS